MKRLIVISFIINVISGLALLSSPLSAAPNLFQQVEKAQLRGNWGQAERLLSQLADQDNSPRRSFAIFTTRAWVAIQLGEFNNARKYFAEAKDYRGKLLVMDKAALKDIEIALVIANQKGLPRLSQRVIVGSGDATGTGGGFDIISQRVEKELKKFMYIPPVKKSFVVPLPPKLVKDEFEKTADFLERVDRAQRSYRKRIKDIREDHKKCLSSAKQKLKRKKLNLPEIKRILTQQAMNDVLGTPLLKDLEYDADNEIFIGQITAGGSYTPVIDHQVAIHVPLKEAKETKLRLVNAQPFLVYRMEEDNMILTGVTLAMQDSTLMNARLTDRKIETVQMTYKVPEIAMSEPEAFFPEDSSIMEDSISSIINLSIDPEIAKLKKKIVATRRKQIAQKARDLEITRLQSELELLESAQESQFEDDLPELLDKIGPVKKNRKKYAVIIGIDNYAETTNVQFAERSARLFEQIAKKILGVPEENIHILTNKDATSGRIGVRINDFVERLDSTSTLYFYFAGHGIPSQKKKGAPYLLPYDMSPAFIHTAKDFMLSNVYKTLTKRQVGRVIVFLDSCFSGNTDNKLVFKGTAGTMLRRIDPDIPAGNILVFSAGNSNQFANYYPEKGHRLFSYYLIRGLIEGKTDPRKLIIYLEDKVSARSRRMGPAYEQTPEIKGDISGGML